MIDPAGQFFEYYACTAGKGRQICKTELDKLDLANLTVRDSVYQMAKMLHKTHEESRDRQFELDMTWICADSGFEAQFVPPEFLKETEAQALADIEAEEMGD
jgi:20S proteasome subunit alpha 7